MRKMKSKTLRNGLKCLSIFSSIFIVISCASHSVRDIRYMREMDKNATIGKTKVSTSDKTLTRNLFMQTKRPNVELPPQDGLKIDPVTGAAIRSEQVTYTNAENDLQKNATVTDTGKVYNLSEVVVTAKSRFTPERNGKVNVDFQVRVPKDVLSSTYQITMLPELIHNDSIVPLKEVIIRGSAFVEKQKQDYQKYQDYLNSIVDKSQYDSVFLDKKTIESDIKKRQEFYYEIYRKDWKLQMEYEQWKKDREAAEATFITQRQGEKAKIYHANALKKQEQVIRLLTQGKDTVGISARYNADYNSKAAKIDQIWEKRAKELSKVPSRFEEIHKIGRTLDELSNDVMIDDDSIAIAKHRYHFDKIAENEAKIARKDEVFKEMVPFPYRDKYELRLDTIVDGGRDFIYYYQQDYPVSEGLKRLRLTMDSKVQAIDLSTYTMPEADTLSFFISSLVQLADTSLIYKKNTIRRNLFNRGVAYFQYPANGFQFNPKYRQNGAELTKFLETYNSFKNNPEIVLDSVMMTATTALDGAFDNNADLSKKRVAAFKEYLMQTLPQGDNVSEIFLPRYRGEDWRTLASSIAKRNDMPNKDAILELLTTAVNPDNTEAEIKKLYKADFKVIQDSIYPTLRKIDFIFFMHRANIENDTVTHEYRPDYEKGIRYLLDRDYWKAIEILADYGDYNTALCLTCMGYNGKAYEALSYITPTGDSEYLFAIVASRMGNEQEAVEHLLKACELDPAKVYRAELDPEVRMLVQKYNLTKQMEDRAHGLSTSEK